MMMAGYHNQPEKTRDAEWRDNDGRRFIRTGDIGRFDDEGFLILLDRSKDVIISGGFNIYPSDIEAEVVRHGAVAEAAVVGVASDLWGETPVAFVCLRPGERIDGAALMDWVNARLGKTQRLHDLRFVESLPRSSIGKVLKRELRERYAQSAEIAGG
jgi:acyl-CoA synthetase (AMP-forming)/AMP-acid ligase II